MLARAIASAATSSELLEPQKDFALIEEAHKYEGQRESDNANEQLAEALGNMGVEEIANAAADQALTHTIEIAAEDIARDVDGDGVHAHPNKGLAPALHFPDVHNEIKRAEQHGAVATGDEDVRGGPDFFDDGEFHAPKPAQAGPGGAKKQQINNFPFVLHLCVTQQEARENTEQAGGDGGKGA